MRFRDIVPGLVVLELGAGSGALCHFLQAALNAAVSQGDHAMTDVPEVRAVDSGRDRIQPTHGSVELLGVEAALQKHKPAVVIVSWMPSGHDWSQAIRDCDSVQEYILLGVADSSTCGDAWTTWGVLPSNAEEYGLDEDTLCPHFQDGFQRCLLEEVARWQICRFDSTAFRGFSCAVSFVRSSAQ